MVVMNEHFLARVASVHEINLELPLRLQKRALLRVLCMPENPQLKACSAFDAEGIERLFNEFVSRERLFLVVVSEKPARTIIPPLFKVVEGEKVIWRNNSGDETEISRTDALSEMRKFSPSSWLEFVPYVWDEETVAGRLLYEGPDTQIIELQKGVVPARIMDNQKLPVFCGEIRDFNLEQTQYVERGSQLASSGYSHILPLSLVQNICEKLRPHRKEFETLRLISHLPTLEFAVKGNGNFFTIDIDWPAQWIHERQ